MLTEAERVAHDKRCELCGIGVSPTTPQQWALRCLVFAQPVMRSFDVSRAGGDYWERQLDRFLDLRREFLQATDLARLDVIARELLRLDERIQSRVDNDRGAVTV